MKTKNQKLSEQLAILYLEHWQLGESQESVHEESGMTQEQIAKKITDLNYPDPNDIIYDNESIPFIHWPEQDFDCEKFYEDYQQQFI